MFRYFELFIAASCVLLLVSPMQAPPPKPEVGDVVISQIYTGGGTPGAAFQNSFIELFNRSNSPRDIVGVPLTFTSATGTFTFSIAFVSSRGITLNPGQHFLIQFGSAGPNGMPLPSPDGSLLQNLEVPGKVALLKFGSSLPVGTCPLADPNILDFVGYGAAANCFEGTGPTANLSNISAALRLNNGCTDTNNNAGDFSVGTPNPRNTSSSATPCGAVISLDSATFNVNEDVGSLSVGVTRSGDTSAPATVDYLTTDSGPTTCASINGQASSRCDYLTTLGKLNFAAGETAKTILIPIVDDVYTEGSESFQLTMSNPTGASLGATSTATVTVNDGGAEGGPNPIDNTGFFVRQHYIDFLNREPDPLGFAFWKNDIDVCGTDPQCIEIKRINVSAAFFLSIEFQETGYLVYRFYKSSFGNLTNPPGAPVPIRFLDFLRDTQQIGKSVQVGAAGWEAVLEANKVAYAADFVQRPEFKNAYPDSMTADQFVTKLDTNAGAVLSPAEKTNLIATLAVNPTDATKRGATVRAVAEAAGLKEKEFNKAFVLAQYFGYLRRNPNDAPDPDFSGFQFWLSKLNQFDGDFIKAEMVKAFISSNEYRQRFGP
ncbi:MAG TPA: Calx-beta domain-containing protein [Pyrinomonadaceae bacterium]